MRTMGSHHSSVMKSDTWLTPKYIIDSLGDFDLDPCCPEIMPWLTAKKNFTKKENGLNQPWSGRVWLNPPYSVEAIKWLNKLADHGNGIALVFARTETQWFFNAVWNQAFAILFLKGRITFCDVNGKPAKANSGAPSCLVAYGLKNKEILENCGLNGYFVDLFSGNAYELNRISVL